VRAVVIGPDSVYVAHMNDSLKKLLEAAKTAKQTPAQLEAQRRSFVYGNTAFENNLITREMVDQEAEKLAREADAGKRERAAE
jgi:hypothetical protein